MSAFALTLAPRHLLHFLAIIVLPAAATTGSARSTPLVPEKSAALATAPLPQLSATLQVGDVVFLHVTPLPFRQVSAATRSWVNHVGIVVDVSTNDPVIAESTFPLSRETTLSRFIQRSERGRVAIARLGQPLDAEQQQAVRQASRKRLGILYDTGFNLGSRRQFCSRFVREVLAESTGITVGEEESFQVLLSRNPEAGLAFWRAWYFGRIPWTRTTVTPDSVYRSNRLHTVFDGHAI